MVDSISTAGIGLACTKTLTSSQTQLSTLSEQLTTGKVSLNLSKYTSSEAQKLLNFNNEQAQQKGFLNVISSIDPRMSVYDSSLDGIEDTSSDAFTTIVAAGTYNSNSNATTQNLVQGYMDQIQYYLNQKVGDRYIYSGSRYGTEPVTDIKALPSPPTETAPYLATGDEVPAYDADYDPLNPTALVPDANIKEDASIDVTKKLTYGVTSNEDGFQQVIMGLRFAYAATNDQTNYDTYMATARDLISKGLANVRATHTDSTNAYATLKKTKENITSNVENLSSQVDNIEAVDMNEVAVKITILQAQLQASYSAVSNMINLSILKYL